MSELTDIERILMTGLVARDQAADQLIRILRADYQTAKRAIEARLGLAAGAIGTTHQIDTDRWIVQPLPDIDHV